MKQKPVHYSELINLIKKIARKDKCKIHFQKMSKYTNPSIILKYEGLKIDINKYYNTITIDDYVYEVPECIKSQLTGYGYVLQPLSEYLFAR